MSFEEQAADLEAVAEIQTKLAHELSEVFTRTTQLHDACAVAVEQGDAAPAEMPVLRSLLARLSAMFGPLETLHEDLRAGLATMTPWMAIARSIDDEYAKIRQGRQELAISKRHLEEVSMIRYRILSARLESAVGVEAK